jgi:hypothetical protein
MWRELSTKMDLHTNAGGTEISKSSKALKRRKTA